MESDKLEWQSFLHWSFLGEHVLIENLRLYSFSTFTVGVLLTSVLCLTERLLTFALSKHWNPFPSTSTWRNALWRTLLYWVVTLLRLIYMLVAVTFNLPLIVVTATALAVGQFIIEIMNSKPKAPRSRSKPVGIFIHPTHSNLARADAAALEMGLGGDTNLVQGTAFAQNHGVWEIGKGKEVAQTLLGRKNSPREPFRIGDDEQVDSD